MQAINNYQNNTNFTGGQFIVPKSCQKRFMRVLRNECDVSDLIRIRNTMENGVGDKTRIYLEDLGYMAGQEVDGHLRGVIGKKEYFNSWPLFAPSSWSIPRFIEKLARKGDKAEIKLRKKGAHDIIEECRIATAYKAQKSAQQAETKLECRRAKNYRDKGLVTEQEQKGYLLGEIYKLIGGKRK